MKDELVRKIGAVLTDGITSEMSLVYLLVEIRKLLDRENYADQTIVCFANWVVHVQLDRKADATTDLLEEFDQAIHNMKVRGVPSPTPRHFTFDGFRDASECCLSNIACR